MSAWTELDRLNLLGHIVENALMRMPGKCLFGEGGSLTRSFPIEISTRDSKKSKDAKNLPVAELDAMINSLSLSNLQLPLRFTIVFSSVGRGMVHSQHSRIL
jgi:hypothetical protein